MRETGTVLSVTGVLAAVRREKRDETDSPEACFGCMNTGCKAGQGRILAANPLKLPLEPGQVVEVETLPSPAIIQAVSALLPPLLGFIAGFFLTALIFPGSGDPARSAGGAVLMFLTAAGLYAYRRKTPVTNTPRIVKILPKAR